MNFFRPAALVAPVVAVYALALSGCAMPGFGPSSPSAPPPGSGQEYPATVRAEELVGRWGYASYTQEKDRARIENAARGACRKPIVISRGSNGGIIMPVADQAQPQELSIKGGPGGKNYIGPPGEPGGPQDQEILSFDGRLLVTKYVDPETVVRFGTSVYVRCGSRA
jgi:hypothetical protein